MFSIAAINDTDYGGQWEPLAPTKEAQEFYLSQKYHEGLLKLQAKDYAKARELLEAVLKDPLISNAQVDSAGSDHHLLQLRFLSLKNLATVFLQQGSEFYESALHCYLQAVELDAHDSVIWNQLGTLSCTMGLLSTSRWAFEQGLLCSPNNWNCMEKLLEVLIAIGDEVACLSVADLILRHWPSHSRALCVKKTIEEAEPVSFAPHGIDKLEPKHVKLKFPNKRKAADEEITMSKRSDQNIELQLSVASWSAVLDGILSLISPSSEKGHDNITISDTTGDTRNLGIHINTEIFAYSKIIFRFPSNSYDKVVSAEQKTNSTSPAGDTEAMDSYKGTMKEKHILTDKEHAHERRSTRLERLRSRKSGGQELEASSKDVANVVFQFLDSFVLRKPIVASDSFTSSDGPYPDILSYTSDLESNDVMLFISKVSNNCGPCHSGHLLLEEVAHIDIPCQDYFVKIMELEKLTRHWGQDRTRLCSLFLAELCYDQGLCSENSEFFSDSSYHLCKVIELVALDFPFHLFDKENQTTTSKMIQEPNDLWGEEPDNSTVNNDFVFWVRFFWLSGCLSLYSGCKEKAYNEFNISLSLLRTNKKDDSDAVFLPHCRLMRLLTVDRVLCEINHIKIDSLLKANDEVTKWVSHAECIKLLHPLLLSTKDVWLNGISGSVKGGETFVSLELSALDALISACENTDPVDFVIYMDCHRRKLQILTVVAGMAGSVASQKYKMSSLGAGSASDSDVRESLNWSWIEMVVEAVKNVSQSASHVRKFIDHNDASVGQNRFSSLVCIIADIQSLLLTVMCSAVKMIVARKHSTSGTSNQTDQIESRCLVDAAIAFCKLQHLDPYISVKTQVDLIVAVHELLAEHGLCCAGRDSEGEEGTFLKFSIRHLLALDVKLKLLHSTNGTEDTMLPHKSAREATILEDSSAQDEQDMFEEGGQETEMEEVELGIDSVLDQAFFCLYGLNINPDSSNEDDLAIHKNTSRGDYQTKEQCADVFQYILPYARALSRTGLVKLRRALRAIRKHFPQPPHDILANNAVDKFLDGPDSCEKKLWEIHETNGSRDSILNVLFTDERNYDSFKKLCIASSGPYLEVYSNLYYFMAQAEEISATEKYAGFVLKKEGEEFVEQNANFFKYDLLYNPLRFESWQKLANIYDEEVDLLLNDGSKHISILEWRKNNGLIHRVEMGRRRSRRCLLMSLTLASIPSQQSQIHELLALVYYDNLQNVVPCYDQRFIIPTKDATWMAFCQNSMKHFEKAFALKPEWLHAFYLGKLCEKLGHSPAQAFLYYSKAVALNPSAVDPFYRMHASRMKLLDFRGKQNLDALQIVTAYTFNQSTKDTILDMFGWTGDDLNFNFDLNHSCSTDAPKEKKHAEPHLLERAWHMLYDDCLSALGICVEGELKHFHKARYMIAQGLYRRGEVGDLQKAKDELSFCFKSARSNFTVNMWEIDGMVRKGRRKNPSLGGNRKSLEVSLSESSRKFITCIRKYILLYLNLLEKTGDSWTLERAYTYLRTDKRFYLCIGDIVPVALGKYIQVVSSAIRNSESRGATNDTTSLEQLLEKMFTVFMDHANLWSDINSLPEVNSPELSENNLYSYIHQYIHLLESDVRLEALEGLNEKIRKRFKSPKLSNSNFAKVCKHASLAWCRSLVIKLAAITPLPDVGHSRDQSCTLGNGLRLYVDLQPDELLISPPDGPSESKGLDMNWFEALSKIKSVQIRQTPEENMEAAVTLLRCTYNFYRESSCTTFTSGIHLWTVLSPQLPAEGVQQGQDVVDILDLSIPRKLLLWAYTLVHGRYLNIAAVVKYCEEMKLRTKRGVAPVSAPQPTVANVAPASGGATEKFDRDEPGETEDNLSVLATCGDLSQEKPVAHSSSQLLKCNSSKTMEAVQDGGNANSSKD